METKNIHQLLIILKEDYQNSICSPNHSLHAGLCSTLRELFYTGKITVPEYSELKHYLWKNRPDRHKIHKNPNYMGSHAFWIPYKTKWRLYWLNKHIKLTS